MKLASVAKTGGKKGPLAPLEVKESISLQNIINSLFCRKLWPESPIAMYRLNRLSLESIAHLCWEAKALQGVALFLLYLLMGCSYEVLPWGESPGREDEQRLPFISPLRQAPMR